MPFELFKRVEDQIISVFSNKEALSSSYVPEVLVCREEEEYFASLLVRGVKENFFPRMVRVYGPPGSGKTVVVKSVLERFSLYIGEGFRYYYVNFKGTRTVFMAANGVLSAISGRKVVNNRGLDQVFLEIWGELRAIKEGRLNVVFVFDEVESIFLDKRYDASDFFYRFLRYHVYLDDPDIKLCLFVITNNPSSFEDHLDARVKSSMGGESIYFQPYSYEEIDKILHDRIESSFMPEYKAQSLEKHVCRMYPGEVVDARKYIDLLRIYGEMITQSTGKVDGYLLKQAKDRVEKEWTHVRIRDLPLGYALVLWYIAHLCRDDGKTSSGEVYKFSRKYRIRNIGEIVIPHLSDRRILDIIKHLDVIGLLTSMNISMGRKGYGKLIRLNVNPENIILFYSSNILKIRLE